MRRLNLIGRVFTRWTVKSFAYSDGQTYWNCLCECGTLRPVKGETLTRKISRSCGCLKEKNHFIHGHGYATRTYNSWQAMIQRCTNPKNIRWISYGGAGVTVCKAWRTFAGFHKSMGDRPIGTSLGRFADSGNYCPGNCSWQTLKQQWAERKKRKNHV